MNPIGGGDLDRRAAALLERYRSPAVLLNRPFPPQSAPVGRTFFGGIPTLPDGFEWPRTSGGVPLHFLCQVDCAEIGWQTPLPDHGILFFFGRDDEEQIWGDGAVADDCRVLYAAECSAPKVLRSCRSTFPRSDGITRARHSATSRLRVTLPRASM